MFTVQAPNTHLKHQRGRAGEIGSSPSNPRLPSVDLTLSRNGVFPGLSPGFWATGCLGTPKQSRGAKGTRKAACGQPLFLELILVAWWFRALGGERFDSTQSQSRARPGFCGLACLPASDSSQGRGCRWGTAAVPRGPPHTAGFFLRWQHKVLMNHAVVVSPCLA